MGLIYVGTKAIWRRFVPNSLKAALAGGQTSFSRAALKAKARLEQSASHEELYDASYFLGFEPHVTRYANGIAASLSERFSPSSVIDVGCGGGAVLVAFRALGIEGIGLEYSDGALAICKEKGLDVQKFDVETDAPPPLAADLAISTEVAEHLPANCADKYVALLLALSRRHVIITAATPGQGGTDHVNEQPYSYWIDKFTSHGAVYNEGLTAALREEWKSRGVDEQRATNVLAFER